MNKQYLLLSINGGHQWKRHQWAQMNKNKFGLSFPNCTRVARQFVIHTAYKSVSMLFQTIFFFCENRETDKIGKCHLLYRPPFILRVKIDSYELRFCVWNIRKPEPLHFGWCHSFVWNDRDGNKRKKTFYSFIFAVLTFILEHLKITWGTEKRETIEQHQQQQDERCSKHLIKQHTNENGHKN